MAYMPASYTTDYLCMVGLALLYAVFGAEGIVHKIKSVFITIGLGGAAGLIWACYHTLLAPVKKEPSLFLWMIYTAWAVFCVFDWLPFQVNRLRVRIRVISSFDTPV